MRKITSAERATIDTLKRLDNLFKKLTGWRNCTENWHLADYRETESDNATIVYIQPAGWSENRIGYIMGTVVKHERKSKVVGLAIRNGNVRLDREYLKIGIKIDPETDKIEATKEYSNPTSIAALKKILV